MHKLLIISILSLLLSACSLSQSQPTWDDIQALKNQIESLKYENANLREENNLLRAGGIPETSNISDGSLFPEWSTFEEWNLESCMKNAHSVFLAAGREKCSKSGYNEAQFIAWECQLTQEDIETVSTVKSNEESNCKSLYQ